MLFRSAKLPSILVVHPSLPAKNVKALIALPRAQPARLTFGTGGGGSGSHLTMELFKLQAKVDLIHVPYKGVAPAVLDLVSGQIGMMLAGISVLKPHTDNNRVRALAVSTAKRSAIAPELPTIVEAGVKGYQTKSWNALVLPRGTPAAIVHRLHAEIAVVLKAPQLTEQLKSQGIEPEPGPPDELARYVREEMVRFQNLIRMVGLKTE